MLEVLMVFVVGFGGHGKSRRVCFGFLGFVLFNF
jgi:hypothetical protein